MKTFPLLLAAILLLAGCALPSWVAQFPTSPAPVKPSADGGALLFDRGLDQLSKGETPEALERLCRQTAASPWKQRAELVLKLHQRNERLSTQQNQAALRQQTVEQELAAREAYIQQLKELIIRNESSR